MKKEESKIEESNLERKNREKKFSKEERKKGFRCIHCHASVSLVAVGTAHRNHCPECLWSKHVDVSLGDRKSTCEGSMIPIGFTLKKEGINKYTGKPRRGELMVIHQCVKCGKIFINRLSGDDNSWSIAEIFRKSFNMPKDLQKELEEQGIDLLMKEKEREVMEQLDIKQSI